MINNTDSPMNKQKDKKSKSRGIGIFSFVLSGMPLVFYPVVFIASIMGLAGHRTPGPLKFIEILAYMFYIATIIYPAIYIVSCLLYFKGNKKKSIFIPYIYLLICSLLFIIMMEIG